MLTCHKYTNVILIHSPIQTYHKHRLKSSFVTIKHLRLCFRMLCLILFVTGPKGNSVVETVVYMSPFSVCFLITDTQIKNLHRNAVIGMFSLINAHLFAEKIIHLYPFGYFHFKTAIQNQEDIRKENVQSCEEFNLETQRTLLSCWLILRTHHQPCHPFQLC